MKVPHKGHGALEVLRGLGQDPLLSSESPKREAQRQNDSQGHVSVAT